MTILFFQTVHSKDDDRVRFHQQVSLKSAGHHCLFASSVSEVREQPNVVICDTPLAIWCVRRLFGRRVKVVYDVTEWYPSKKNLRNIPWWAKPLKWCTLVIANYQASWSTDAFIFGEFHKGQPLRILFPWKRHVTVPYYPSLNYIRPMAPQSDNTIRLLYAGPKTAEKGYFRVCELSHLCENKLPDRKVILTTINGVSFDTFCKEITHYDFFLDLRDDDWENSHCLPIKLFYYLAAGRPVIYSDLRAIRHGVPEIANDSLVNPACLDKAAEMICRLISQPDQYKEICKRNRLLAEKKYNWGCIHDIFIHFIEDL